MLFSRPCSAARRLPITGNSRTHLDSLHSFAFLLASSNRRLRPLLNTGLPFVPVRLTGSGRAGAGRLEVWSNDTWAAVASSAATANATRWSWVVSRICQDLGFLRGASFAGNLFYPPGSMSQWRSVACLGNETSASACVWASLLTGSSASPDINVVCTNAASGKLAQAVQHAHTQLVRTSTTQAVNNAE